MSYRTASRVTLAFLAGLLLSAATHAQVFRAYIASDGNDANPCTLPAPCRLLPAALTAVASGGEIWMLDSANYNTATVTIAKSVTILATPGAVGSLVVTAGPAIRITAPSLTIALRNLVIVPLTGASGSYGVEMTGASMLTIDGCALANLPADAVRVVGTGKVAVTNTVIRNNGGYAVWLENGATGDISSTKFLNNGNGVMAYSGTATTTLAISDSIIAGGSQGAYAYTEIAGAVARIFVTRSTIQDTGYALNSSGTGNSLIAVSGSMVTNNSFAWYQSGAGAVVRSLGNNHLTDNSGSNGVLTTSALQ